MMPRTVTQLGRLKKLARTGAWAATSAMLVFAVTPGQRGWMWVALAAMVALNAAGVAAAIAELRADGRWRGVRRKGGGRGGRGRGRDDGDGSVGQAVRGWHALAVASRLMPASAGRRWLAEAESVLAEVPPARRGPARAARSKSSRAGYPVRTGGLWLWSTLVLSLFHAVVVPSGLTTRVQPRLWIMT
jgi:hypothetical protein